MRKVKIAVINSSSEMCLFRSIFHRCSVKKGVLENFVKFTGKHLCHGLVFNKVAGQRPATLLKKRHWHRCFPVNLAKFSRASFFKEHLLWLLPSVVRGFSEQTYRKTLYISPPPVYKLPVYKPMQFLIL